VAARARILAVPAPAKTGPAPIERRDLRAGATTGRGLTGVVEICGEASLELDLGEIETRPRLIAPVDRPR
jgi:hypothetical protein